MSKACRSGIATALAAVTVAAVASPASEARADMGGLYGASGDRSAPMSAPLIPGYGNDGLSSGDGSTEAVRVIPERTHNEEIGADVDRTVKKLITDTLTDTLEHLAENANNPYAISADEDTEDSYDVKELVEIGDLKELAQYPGAKIFDPKEDDELFRGMSDEQRAALEDSTIIVNTKSYKKFTNVSESEDAFWADKPAIPEENMANEMAMLSYLAEHEDEYGIPGELIDILKKRFSLNPERIMKALVESKDSSITNDEVEGIPNFQPPGQQLPEEDRRVTNEVPTIDTKEAATGAIVGVEATSTAKPEATVPTTKPQTSTTPEEKEAQPQLADKARQEFSCKKIDPIEWKSVKWMKEKYRCTPERNQASGCFECVGYAKTFIGENVDPNKLHFSGAQAFGHGKDFADGLRAVYPQVKVDNTPQPGSIVSFPEGGYYTMRKNEAGGVMTGVKTAKGAYGKYGHVAVVKQVFKEGQYGKYVRIAEYNMTKDGAGDGDDTERIVFVGSDLKFAHMEDFYTNDVQTELKKHGYPDKYVSFDDNGIYLDDPDDIVEGLWSPSQIRAHTNAIRAEATDKQKTVIAAIEEVFPAELVDEAILVSYGESKLSPDAREYIEQKQPDGTTKLVSEGHGHGAFQIDTRYHEKFFRNHNWNNPEDNARYALRLYQERGNWSAFYAAKTDNLKLWKGDIAAGTVVGTKH